MIDKICCMVYKAINLMAWIVCGLACIAGTAFIVIIPYLGCRYGYGVSVKNSIIATVVFWGCLIFVGVIDAAYVRGRDLKQKSNKEQYYDWRN